MRKCNKILSVLLLLALVLALVSVSALAEEAEAPEIEIETESETTEITEETADGNSPQLRFSLDNNGGLYNADYIADYGTISYSTDDGESWTALPEGESSPVLDGVEEVLLKIDFVNAEAEAWLRDAGVDPQQLTSGAEFTYRGQHIEFVDAAPGGEDEGGGEEGGNHYCDFYGATYDGPTVHVTYSLDGSADFTINNGVETGLGAEEGEEYEYSYTQPEGAETVDFYFNSLFIKKYTTLEINGVDYTDQLPTDDLGLLLIFGSQINHYKITGVPAADHYDIVAERGERSREEIAIGNFLWASPESETAQEDDIIEGGIIRLVKAEYKGEDEEIIGALEELFGSSVIYDINDESTYGNLENGSVFDWTSNDIGTDGCGVFPADTYLTIELIPEYGKQLVSFGVNNFTFTASEDAVATYTFPVKRGNFHLAAKFEAVENTVSLSDNEAVSDVSYEIDGSPVCGTLNMNVTEVENEEAVAAVDISLENVFYQGTDSAEGAWVDPVSELEDATATVTLDIDGLDADGEYIVIREHDGEDPVELEATVSEDGSSISFDTDKFSMYTVLRTDTPEEEPTEEPTDEEPTEETTEEPTEEPTEEKPEESPAPEDKPDGKPDGKHKGDVPATGDSNPLVFWILLASVSLCALVAVCGKKKQK